jgi:uncharacterized protein (TIGR03435 family)
MNQLTLQVPRDTNQSGYQRRKGTARLGVFLLPVLLPMVLAAQTPQPPPAAMAFTAADIHPSPLSYGGSYFHTAPFTGDRFVAHQATPLNLIMTAYRVEADAVTGGPPGLEFDRYEIVAKTPPGTTEKDTAPMLQTLLADRFKLSVRLETKPLPAFLLKAGSAAAKMKPAADPTADSGCRLADQPAPGTPLPPTITVKCSNTTMEQFAELLYENVGQFNHPVVDATGMTGGWDFDFRFTWQPGAPDAITIFEAVNRLGLKLEAGTAPRPALTIVSMADAPTPNPPGIEKLLPPPPLPSFEVATIRPSKNESKQEQVQFQGVEQVTFSGSELRLICLAWDISEKTIFEAPPFSNDKVWEITAKIPAPDTPLAPGKRTQIDFDQVRLMLQSLMAERFGLKVHTEDRPGSGYTLLPSIPKMKKGDPANRASCTDRVLPGEKDPRAANPMATQYMHCTNVTVDQFARELEGYSGYIIKTPVLNKSGIEGRYDLTLSFTGIHQLELLGLAQGSATPKPSATGGDKSGGGGTGEGADPGGVPVMLQDAVAKQLGLKLVLEKRPIPALVIDHIEETPTEN